jgi:hypothetical protein
MDLDVAPLRTPDGGWPVACLKAELSFAENIEQAAKALCLLSRQLAVGVGAEFVRGAAPMIAFPDQGWETVLALYEQRQRVGRAYNDGGANRELWIDGRAYVVPLAVFNHVRHIETLNHTYARRLERYTMTQVESVAPATVSPHHIVAPDPPDSGRWVPSVKADVVRAIMAAAISRERAIELYQLTPQELESWEDAYRRDGLRGLSQRQEKL